MEEDKAAQHRVKSLISDWISDCEVVGFGSELARGRRDWSRDLTETLEASGGV